MAPCESECPMSENLANEQRLLQMQDLQARLIAQRQEISATPLYYEQNGGDKVLLIDANFGKNNGYNNYYNVDDIDVRMKDTLQEYFGEGESRGYDVYTIPYDNERFTQESITTPSITNYPFSS